MVPSLDQYETKKAKGLITIQHIDDTQTYAIYTKAYDLEKARVGELVEVSPTVEGPVSLGEIDEKIAGLETEKARWKTLRDDLLATK